jgi:hypothetical protein
MPAPGDRITKRKDGRWMGRYTVQTPTRPKRKPVYGRTYKEVEKKLALAMGDAARGIVYDDENQTVGEYRTRWLSDSAKHAVKATTYRAYESQIRKHIIPALGKVKRYRQMLWIETRSRGVLLLFTSFDQCPILEFRSGSHQRHQMRAV